MTRQDLLESAVRSKQPQVAPEPRSFSRVDLPPARRPDAGEIVLWGFRASRAPGFELADWPAQLDTWIELPREELTSESFAEIEPFYDWMLVNRAALAALSEESGSTPWD